MSQLRDALWTPRGSRRYGVVLLLIVLSLVFQMAAPDRPGFRLLGGLLQLATLALAIHASDVHRRDRPVVAVLLLLGGVALMVAHVTGGETARGMTATTSGILTAITLGTIGLGVVIGIREHSGVTVQAVIGVVCVYLLIGLVFAYAYGAIAAFEDGSFFAQGTDGDHQDQLYFSLITQTTVGYGDFTPGGDLGRSLAAVEALIGQLYLVTIVALIVSNVRPRRRGSAEPEA
jgi:hypothetical protein